MFSRPDDHAKHPNQSPSEPHAGEWIKVLARTKPIQDLTDEVVADLPRKPDQPDPKPWRVDGNIIWCDSTKRTRFKAIDGRANDSYTKVAQILATGPNAEVFANFIVDVCNQAAEESNRFPKLVGRV